MYDVIAIGEVLIDLTPGGRNDAGIQLFAANPGGAPANVLAMVARLGGKTAFIGKVGADRFGSFLRETLGSVGIDVTALRETTDYNTTLAIVHLDETGERSFSFYRRMGADKMLEKSDLPFEMLASCRILHFGSVSLTEDPVRTATLTAVQRAKDNGALISFDVNYRPLLWTDEHSARQVVLSAVAHADVLKVSFEELTLLTGETDTAIGAMQLLSYGLKAVLVTLGADGAYYCTRYARGRVPTWKVMVEDTTGAGDAFTGALLYQLQGMAAADIEQMGEDAWLRIVRFANACGTLTTMRSGAIPAMPGRDAIHFMMETNLPPSL